MSLSLANGRQPQTAPGDDETSTSEKTASKWSLRSQKQNEPPIYYQDDENSDDSASEQEELEQSSASMTNRRRGRGKSRGKSNTRGSASSRGRQSNGKKKGKRVPILPLFQDKESLKQPKKVNHLQQPKHQLKRLTM